MIKKLTPLGNSMALLFDSTTRRILGIERDDWLRLTFDGKRMIVEVAEGDLPPVCKPVSTTTSKVRVGPSDEWKEALRIAMRVRELNFPREHFRKGAIFLLGLWMNVQEDLQFLESLRNRRLLERARICIERHAAGATAKEAYEAALEAVPSLDAPDEPSLPQIDPGLPPIDLGIDELAS